MFTSSSDPELLRLLHWLLLLVAAVNLFDGVQTIMTGVIQVGGRACVLASEDVRVGGWRVQA